MGDTDLLQIRFGYGLGRASGATDPEAMLTAALAPDETVRRYPVLPFAEAMILEGQRRAARGDDPERARALRTRIRAEPGRSMAATFARLLDTPAPLRERLVWFWADHFTVVARNEAQRAGTAGYIDEAIRPHVTGRFIDMLKAVSRHPAMLLYLDQHASVGPDSAVGQDLDRGLNENFARELMELHTLGVGGGYGQGDVRAAAELLTGMTLDKARRFTFRPALAQPGPETVLGQTYGGDGPARLADIDTLLEDLARHPDTIRHLAAKLAVHFVADDPPPGLVADLADTWAESDGDLAVVTRRLVTHPDALSRLPGKVKSPMTFMVSALQALGLRGTDLQALARRDVARLIATPLKAMGQPFLRAPGPDGWPEQAADWITPQGLAERINWAGRVVKRWGQEIEDPRAFLDASLRGIADDALRFAVAGAETRAEALVLVLASPAFNRS